MIHLSGNDKGIETGIVINDGSVFDEKTPQRCAERCFSFICCNSHCIGGGFNNIPIVTTISQHFELKGRIIHPHRFYFILIASVDAYQVNGKPELRNTCQCILFKITNSNEGKLLHSDREIREAPDKWKTYSLKIETCIQAFVGFSFYCFDNPSFKYKRQDDNGQKQHQQYNGWNFDSFFHNFKFNRKFERKDT